MTVFTSAFVCTQSLAIRRPAASGAVLTLALALSTPISAGCGRLNIALLPVSGGGDGLTDADGGVPLDCSKDQDDDGILNCDDGCPSDPDKSEPGLCGCSSPDIDTDGDGELDCVDACNGVDDENYQPRSCGIGYCEQGSTLSSCEAGVETQCVPGEPLSASDETCDGVDDNCSGQADEGYVPQVASCGQGYCETTATAEHCSNGSVVPCEPGTPLANNDDTADGVDDDCDGQVDEDTCLARTETFAYQADAYAIVAGACTKLSVKLWGGAGAAGSNDGGAWGVSVTGGQGGAGGYAAGEISVSPGSTLQLLVGQGGQGCGRGGGENQNTSYKGGAGSTSNGGDGSKGGDTVATGGAGANPSSGGRGGAGSYGGGGGGAGSKLYSSFGAGGDGGAATVLLLNGTRSVLAGGGGGGGGAGTTVIASGVSGGAGGNGCGVNGSTGASQGGGGGGGGLCQGTTTQRGTGVNPYTTGSTLPSGTAVGGEKARECAAGGNGYATITFGI